MKTKTVFDLTGMYLPTLNKKKTPIRFCPECDKCVPHFNNQKRDISEREGKLCKRCCMKGDRNHFYGKFHSKESIDKMKSKLIGKPSWNNGLKGLYKPTFETKLKTSNSMKGKHTKENNPFYGKNHSKNTKLKMKKSHENRNKTLHIVKWANYNPDACKYLDNLSKQMGWNIQHALNGGEYKILNYLLDGYDVKQNIVVEYDEPRHRQPSKKEYDIKRQNEIIKYLKCKFFRYDECSGILYEVNQIV